MARRLSTEAGRSIPVGRQHADVRQVLNDGRLSEATVRRLNSFPAAPPPMVSPAGMPGQREGTDQ